MIRLNGVGFIDRGKLEVDSNLKTHLVIPFPFKNMGERCRVEPGIHLLT